MKRDTRNAQRLPAASRRACWFLVAMILVALFAAQSLGILILLVVLAAIPWEMWISARPQPTSDRNNREGSLTRWMRMRGFLKRWWRWVAVLVTVVNWAIGTTVLSESRGTSLYRRSQLLLPVMSQEEVIRTMGSAPSEERELAAAPSGVDPRTFPAVMLIWEDDRWCTSVFLSGEGKFVIASPADKNPTMLTRWSGWLHQRLNWRVTDTLWRWSL